MSGSGMFSEFISLISDIFSMFFLQKYLVLYLAVAVGLGCFIVSKIVRWLNA